MEDLWPRLRLTHHMTAEDRPRESSFDPELVDAAIAGDSSAFRELVLHFDPGLRSLAFRLLRDRDRMDDVLQDAYLKAFRSLAEFRSESGFGTWLYRIAYNACLDDLRREGKREWVEFEEESHGLVGPDPSERVADRLVVNEAFSQLSPGYQAVLVLIDERGFDYQTAGEILGVPSGTVASRLHRARDALYRALPTERSRR